VEARVSLLAVRDVSRSFGGLRAVDGVSLSLGRGARHGLIGPNGAGKSTLFALITGALRPTAGRIEFDGRDIGRDAVDARARLGMAQTFQHSNVFASLTCRENVMLALQRVGLRHVPAVAREAQDALVQVELSERADVLAGEISHGERRRLELSLALACRPTLLLLDEPAAGLSAAETDRLAAMLQALPRDLTVLLIEHDLELVFRVAREVTVLNLGAVVASGPVEEIRASEEVQRIYLGLQAGEELFTDADEEPPDGPARG
jgi:branched-chain amino acid transport system ATP-binding protein